jgi:hypothetical protein
MALGIIPLGTILPCVRCEAFFIKTVSNRKFCSARCTKTFHNRKWELKNQKQLICEFCGVIFNVRPSEQKTRRYCSLTCAGAGRRAITRVSRPKRFKTPDAFFCTWCGREFKNDDVAGIARRKEFCSNKCKKKFWRALRRLTPKGLPRNQTPSDIIQSIVLIHRFSQVQKGVYAI